MTFHSAEGPRVAPAQRLNKMLSFCRFELRSALRPFDFAQGSAEGKITPSLPLRVLTLPRASAAGLTFSAAPPALIKKLQP
jgi:hypothetical protein